MCVFPRGSVEWDEDLVRNSEGRNVEGVQVETLVKVRRISDPLERPSLLPALTAGLLRLAHAGRREDWALGRPAP